MTVKASAINSILNNVGLAILFIILAGGIVQYMAPHFGWRVGGLLSGSMAPEMERGALVVAAPVQPTDIAVGDVILFWPVSIGEDLLAHRVIRTGGGSPLYFTTKGDANAAPEPYPVPARNVVGKVVFHMPLLGFASIFLDTPVGFAVGVALPGVTLILTLFYSLLSELKRMKRSPDK